MARFQANKASKAFSLVFSLILLCGLMSAGCGSGGGSTAHGNVMAAPSTTKVNIIHKIVSKALNSKVAYLEITSFDGKGVPQMEPYVTAKRSEISLDVPVSSKSMRIVYQDSSHNPVGIYVKPVQLKVKEEYTIEDPAWQDADSQTCFTGIRLNPDAAKVKVGEMVHLEAFGQFAAENATFEQSITDVAGWEAYNDKFVSNRQGGVFVGVSAGETKVTAFYFDQIAIGDITIFSPDSEDFFIDKILTKPTEIPMGYDLFDPLVPSLRLTDGTVVNAFLYPETDYEVGDTSVLRIKEIKNDFGQLIEIQVYPRSLGETTLTFTHKEEGREFADIVINYIVSDETLKYIETFNTKGEVALGRGYNPGTIGYFNEDCRWDVLHLCTAESSDETVMVPSRNEFGFLVGYSTLSEGVAIGTVTPPEGIKFKDTDDVEYDEWSVEVTVNPAVIDHLEGNFSGDSISINVGDTITFEVIAVWSDDSDIRHHRTSVTNECTFTTSKPAVVEFSSLKPNEATGKAPGVSVVNCIYGSAFEPLRYAVTVN